jgi:hypothetical protein
VVCRRDRRPAAHRWRSGRRAELAARRRDLLRSLARVQSRAIRRCGTCPCWC